MLFLYFQIMFHPSLGITLLEVKVTNNTKTINRAYESAVFKAANYIPNQLDRLHSMLCGTPLFTGKTPRVPLRRIICFPNVELNLKREAGKNKTWETLDSSYFDNQVKFQNLWNKKLMEEGSKTNLFLRDPIYQTFFYCTIRFLFSKNCHTLRTKYCCTLPSKRSC